MNGKESSTNYVLDSFFYQFNCNYNSKIYNLLDWYYLHQYILTTANESNEL